METNSSYIPDQNANCTSRLPCGVCMITGSMCPLWYGKIGITWGQKTGTELKYTYGTSTEGGQTNG